MYSKEELDFAYKYPFSEEAKNVIAELGLNRVDQKHIIIGKARVEEAFQNGRIEYKETGYGKVDFVIAYAYARMLVSTFRNLACNVKYAEAEANRAAQAMEKDSEHNLIRLAGELGMEIKRSGDGLFIGFAQFLTNVPQNEDFSLANMQLRKGIVEIGKHQLVKLLESAAKRRIENGLPIKNADIPKLVIDYAKTIKPPIAKLEYRPKPGKITWVDRLLETPIPDCRHRTVNLILAPYLANVKGYSTEEATRLIMNYITLCKTVNPDTNITERYIRYQCEYAKRKGMRTLSLKRARTELSAIDFNLLLGEDEKRGIEGMREKGVEKDA